jgi:SAM-dependent methyltransferase
MSHSATDSKHASRPDTDSYEFKDRGGCALCQADDYQLVHDFDRIPVVRCASCGFLYSARVMTDESLRRYYSLSFGSTRQMQGQQVNAEINWRAIKRIVDVRACKNMLDVGTGYGYLLLKFQQSHGLKATGVELSQEEALFARDQLNLDVRPCALSEAGLEKESFDLVTASEVIEHIIDPISFVHELAQYVRPGGVLMINTDNFESQVVRDMGASFPKWIPHCHVSHFAPESLQRCIETFDGLKVEAVTSFTTWENVVRAKLRKRKPIPPPNECYRFEDSVKAESDRSFPMFGLRKFVNAKWFSLACRNDLDGAMMFVAARKAN